MKKLTYKALISAVGAVTLILQCLGVKVDVAIVNEVVTGIAGVLVTLGILLPEKKSVTSQISKENTVEEVEQNSN